MLSILKVCAKRIRDTLKKNKPKGKTLLCLIRPDIRPIKLNPIAIVIKICSMYSFSNVPRPTNGSAPMIKGESAHSIAHTSDA
jgi:hypothetical protein